jgi:ABC-type multidrug transport system ATPase subunit
MVAPALVIDDLTVSYGKHLAVDGLSLTLNAGEIVGLLGPNGAGKSTALSAVAGVLAPTRGRVIVAGRDLAKEPLAARARVGFADQPPALHDFFTVTEQLRFVAEARGATDPSREEELLARLGLTAVAGRLCRELSFGMRQRVGLAAAMIGGVEVILLDETLNGLDPRAGKAAREVVAAAAQAGAAILMSTHLLGVAERLCDRIAVMDEGRLKADVGSVELTGLLARGPGALEELYLTHVVTEST